MKPWQGLVLLAVLVGVSCAGRAFAAGPGDAADESTSSDAETSGGDGSGPLADDAGDAGAASNPAPALACDGALCATDPGFTTCGVARGVGTDGDPWPASAARAVAALALAALRRRRAHDEERAR
jgi:hypothetical protein